MTAQRAPGSSTSRQKTHWRPWKHTESAGESLRTGYESRMSVANPLLQRLLHKNERERLRDVIARDFSLIRECIETGRFRKVDVFREVIAMNPKDQIGEVCETTFWRYYESEAKRLSIQKAEGQARPRSRMGRPPGSKTKSRDGGFRAPSERTAPARGMAGAPSGPAADDVTVGGGHVASGRSPEERAGATQPGTPMGGSESAPVAGDGGALITGQIERPGASGPAGERVAAVVGQEPPVPRSVPEPNDNDRAPASAAVLGANSTITEPGTAGEVSPAPAPVPATESTPPANAAKGGSGEQAIPTAIPLSASESEVLRLREEAARAGAPIPEVVAWTASPDIPPEVKAAYKRKPPLAPGTPAPAAVATPASEPGSS